MNSRNYIIITSINTPTEAVKKFSQIDNYNVIVVGDRKTVIPYEYPGVDFISIKEQESMDFKLIKKLPYNHYCRKMAGYLKAIRAGAVQIIDTDDDNIPYDEWGFPEFEGTFDSVPGNKGFINIYQAFTEQKIWPRGLPLKFINQKEDFNLSIQRQKCKVGIWQGLANEDPDVDAIYRLTSDQPCFFDKREPLVCKKGTLSPFNTQNTLIRRELFPLLYLPTFVTFRYTDILRGLVAQPIMWLQGYELGFTQPTVVQKRNPHDYFSDFLSEIPMYETSEKVIDIVTGSIQSSLSIEENMISAYKGLFKNNIIKSDELEMLEAWLSDLSNITWR